MRGKCKNSFLWSSVETSPPNRAVGDLISSFVFGDLQKKRLNEKINEKNSFGDDIQDIKKSIRELVAKKKHFRRRNGRNTVVTLLDDILAAF